MGSTALAEILTSTSTMEATSGEKDNWALASFKSGSSPPNPGGGSARNMYPSEENPSTTSAMALAETATSCNSQLSQF